jgi:4a-hydroxytetrahydrobiopterin dehydratase
MGRPKRVDPVELRAFLATHRGWHDSTGKLARTFAFRSYVAGLTFANAVGLAGDDAGHHPDLIVGYRKVTVNWTTHDAKGITPRDLWMVDATDAIFAGRKAPR